jgi:isorenieratene synthase
MVAMGRLIVVGGGLLPPGRQWSSRPVWVQCRQDWITRALGTTQARATGGWFVVDASRRIVARPRRFVIASEPLVVFRDDRGRVVAGPDRCPHLGARLSDGKVACGRVVCPWHGLGLGSEPRGSWRPVPTHDDGVLVWVRLDEPGEIASERPYLPARPERFIAGVINVEARCDPCDVIANRLDPWHGPTLHPYRFARLQVRELGEDSVVVRVATWVSRPLAVEVDARFHSPERRTIVMTIVAGVGEGSVVETHATPIEPGRTAIVEASLASSRQPAFRLALPLARLIRPWIEGAASRLWVDDGRYAERLCELRAHVRP